MSKDNKHVVIGAFAHLHEARLAIRELRDARFPAEDIGVISRESDGDRERVETTERTPAVTTRDEEARLMEVDDLGGTKAGEGAAAGAAVGAGGGALWAIGIAAGLLPAIGPVIAGGLLAALIASAASGAAAGGIIGALVGLGIKDEEAAYYERELQRGRAIVVVRPRGRAGEAIDIMRRHRSSHWQATYIDDETKPVV